MVADRPRATADGTCRVRALELAAAIVGRVRAALYFGRMRYLNSKLPWICLWVFGSVALAAPPQPPSVVYGDLFDAVQRARIFPDSKTFADAVPKETPAIILEDYRNSRGAPGFDLTSFVARHFTLPVTPDTHYHSDPGQNVCEHIDALWPILTREPDEVVAGGSLLPLPHRYVVPGGRFREIYYWDSYFTMLGLEDRHPDLVRDMLDNFAYLIDAYGHIPNGNRTYYLSRSQPPFFAAMVALAAKRAGDIVYAKYLSQLRSEYAFWMEGADGLAPGGAHRRVVRLADGRVLNRYWDDRAAPRDESWREDLQTADASGRPTAEVFRNLRAAAESGWDFSSRWLADGRSLVTIRTIDLLPVDLNSLLVELERAISRGSAASGDLAEAERWARRAERRAATIRELFWNAKRRTFTDFLWRELRPADAVTAAGQFPLYFGIADETQAREAASTLRLTLLRPEGIVPTPFATGQQWDAPNGWAPLQWIAIGGLRRYGEPDLADAIAQRWRAENDRVFARTGKLVEKYDVTGDDEAHGGEYPNQDGFGWTNGVLWAIACADAPSLR